MTLLDSGPSIDIIPTTGIPGAWLSQQSIAKKSNPTSVTFVSGGGVKRRLLHSYLKILDRNWDGSGDGDIDEVIVGQQNMLRSMDLLSSESTISSICIG